MTDAPDIVRTVIALREQVAAWRRQGEAVALVPTMGALHEGHLSLMKLAKERADRLVVSIFVNPTQFAPGEDYEKYPRAEKEDVGKLAAVNADLAFVPSVAEMYPEGFSTEIRVTGLTDVLCGAARPGHFDGVALIVTKLLLQTLPDIAVFGEKDYQQLQIIRRFAADLNIPVEIAGGPILREPDGLAMSSRNRYLDPDQRQIATRFPRILQSVRDAVANGAAPLAESARAAREIVAAGFDSVDYVEVRDAANLALAADNSRPCRVFGAARIGATRLIDNWAVE